MEMATVIAMATVTMIAQTMMTGVMPCDDDEGDGDGGCDGDGHDDVHNDGGGDYGDESLCGRC